MISKVYSDIYRYHSYTFTGAVINGLGADSFLPANCYLPYGDSTGPLLEAAGPINRSPEENSGGRTNANFYSEEAFGISEFCKRVNISGVRIAKNNDKRELYCIRTGT